MKSNFTIEQIQNFANKLLFNLTDEEANTIQNEFDVIESDMNLINGIPNIESVEPAFTPYDLYVAEMREDIISPSVPIDELFKNCDAVIDREIKVPKVVGNNEDN